jgi:outer membrane murein-binding lipoprotein Lpp
MAARYQDRLVIGAWQNNGWILHKYDNAEASVIQDEVRLNRMKTTYLKMNWLILLLGIAVVAGSLVAGAAYRDLERKIQTAEAYSATLDRLYQDHQLSAALKTIHEGAADAAAQRLDLLLCDNILLTNEELLTADPGARAYVEDSFRRIAMLRPKTPASGAAGSTQVCNNDQESAQRILELALARHPGARTK